MKRVHLELAVRWRSRIGVCLDKSPLELQQKRKCR